MNQKGISDTEVQCLNEIRLHLRRAIKTLKLQPYQKGDKPNGLRSSWSVLNINNDMSGMGRIIKNSIKPTPKQITHMQFWIDQILTLDEEKRRIVMARAAGIPWRRLEEIDGRSHTTLRKIEKTALNGMIPKLIKGRSILPRDMIA